MPLSSEVEVYQLRVYLRKISPIVWRRILVRSDSTIADLHHTLQIVMNWDDYHLHEFLIRSKRYDIAQIGACGFTDDAHQLLRAARSHWGIENALHWVLDVAMSEDDSRICEDNAPENIALLRRIALTLLKQEKTLKRGIQGKRLKAALSPDYLLKVLST